MTPTSPPGEVLTPRLALRHPVEDDRQRFVELFGDEQFMAFSGGVLAPSDAHRRFDGMLERAQEVTFAKQPIVERSSGEIVGYTGVDRFDFEGTQRLEWGYRLVAEAQGKGYATEAGRALLTVADHEFSGELLAIIDPTNSASQNVARKLGFTFWKQAVVDGFVDDLFRRQTGERRG